MEKVRKKYSLEFKISSVDMSIKCGRIIDVAQELGISENTLSHWKKLHKDGKLTSSKLTATDITKEDLLKLRKEIKNIKLERDILKKELSIFCKKGRQDINLLKIML